MQFNIFVGYGDLGMDIFGKPIFCLLHTLKLTSLRLKKNFLFTPVYSCLKISIQTGKGFYEYVCKHSCVLVKH